MRKEFILTGALAACSLNTGFDNTAGALGGLGMPPNADGTCSAPLVVCTGLCQVSCSGTGSSPVDPSFLNGRWIATNELSPLNVLNFANGGAVLAERMDPGEGLLEPNEDIAALDVTTSLSGDAFMLGGDTFTLQRDGNTLLVKRGADIFRFIQDKRSEGCPIGTSTIHGTIGSVYFPPDGSAPVRTMVEPANVRIVTGRRNAPESRLAPTTNGEVEFRCMPKGRYYLAANRDTTYLATGKLREFTMNLESAYSKNATGMLELQWDDINTTLAMNVSGLSPRSTYNPDNFDANADWLAITDGNTLDQGSLRGAIPVSGPTTSAFVSKLGGDNIDHLTFSTVDPGIPQALFVTQYSPATVPGLEFWEELVGGVRSTVTITKGQGSVINATVASSPTRTVQLSRTATGFASLDAQVASLYPGARDTNTGIILGLARRKRLGGLPHIAVHLGQGTGPSAFAVQVPFANVFAPAANEYPVVQTQTQYIAGGRFVGTYEWMQPLADTNELRAQVGLVRNIKVNGASGAVSGVGRAPIVTWDAPSGTRAPSRYVTTVDYPVPFEGRMGTAISSTESRAPQAQLILHQMPAGPLRIVVKAVWDEENMSSGQTELFAVGPITAD